MIFEEYADKYGIEAARKQFRMGEHLVLTVYPGRRVVGQCGGWIGSEPLAMGQTAEAAIAKLIAATEAAGPSVEVIWADPS